MFPIGARKRGCTGASYYAFPFDSKAQQTQRDLHVNILQQVASQRHSVHHQHTAYRLQLQ